MSLRKSDHGLAGQRPRKGVVVNKTSGRTPSQSAKAPGSRQGRQAATDEVSRKPTGPHANSDPERHGTTESSTPKLIAVTAPFGGTDPVVIQNETASIE